MRKITQTIVGTTPPLDKNVLWLDTTNSNSPVEKVFLNGTWIPTSAAGGEYYTKDEVDENFMGKIDNPNVGNILVMDENGKAVDSLTKPANFISNPEVAGQEHAVLSLDSHGNPVWTPLTPGGDVIESEMKDDSDKAVQNGVIKKYVDNNCARKDGYYSQMTVGSAENLVGQTVDSADYLIRPTGGESNEVANGVASVLGMEGNSCVWSQIFSPAKPNPSTSNGINFTKNANGSYTVQGTATARALSVIGSNIPVHNNKIYIRYSKNAINLRIEDAYSGRFNINKSSILNAPSGRWDLGFSVASGESANYTVFVNIFDLTLFGIDNLTTVTEVEEWLAQHVGTKPHYAYNAGTILSAQTLGIKTYGQNLLNPTTRQAKLIPYTWEENSNVYTIKNVPSANDLQITYTPDATGVAVTIYSYDSENPTPIPDYIDISEYGGSGVLYISAATADTYVCMKWDEQKDDDVVPFEEHTQEFDVRKVYGKINGAGEYVQCFPNGMRSAGSVHDTLTASEAVSKIGSVDLGTRTWSYVPVSTAIPYGSFTAIIRNGKVSAQLVSTKYIKTTSFNVDKSAMFAAANAVYIQDSAYTDAATFKTAMNGVMLNYELATPITYTNLVYRDGGTDRPLSDALMDITVNNWSIEEQLLAPYDENGNPTAVPAKISTQYGMDAVEEIDTIKHTYVSAYSEQNFNDSQKAQARRNIGAVEEDGTYPNMSVGIAKNLAGENAVEAEYTYRPSNGTIGTNTGIANVTAVKGKTLKWQQAIDIVSNGSKTINGVTFSTNKDDKTVTISGESESATAFNYGLANITGAFSINNPIVGHTYIYWALGSNDVALAYGYYGNYNTKYIHVANNTDINFTIKANANFSTPVTVKLCAIDLTDLFGAGNEPTTVAEFEAPYPLDYYAYTATPVLINNNASAIETTGFNQWDEEWENGIYGSDGAFSPNASCICSKNKIRVFPNTSYSLTLPAQLVNGVAVCYYDIDGNFISRVYVSSTPITTPANCYYINFNTFTADLYKTYNHNICINISNPAKNGTYEPYEKHTFYFDKVLQGEGSLATIKGKLNGEGESVVVFPDGLRKVGNVFDEIKGNVAIKRIGVVDLGEFDYNMNEWNGEPSFTPQNFNFDHFVPPANNDTKVAAITPLFETVTRNTNYNNTQKLPMMSAVPTGFQFRHPTIDSAADFKTAMSGVPLYYELAEPETYILDQTVTGGYQVNALGTEKRLPEDTASAVNAPVSYSVIYPIDAVGTITKLPINYISEGSLTNFTTELASKLGTFLSATIGISATYNHTTQEYDYSITITSNENNG